MSPSHRNLNPTKARNIDPLEEHHYVDTRIVMYGIGKRVSEELHFGNLWL